MTGSLRRRRDWELEDVKAIPRFPSLHVDIAGPSYMLVEDVASSIVPFNTRSDSGTFKARADSGHVEA